MDSAGVEPALHPLFFLVGPVGVEPTSSGFQPDAITGLAQVPRLVPRGGVEPPSADSETAILPLDDLGMWRRRRDSHPLCVLIDNEAARLLCHLRRVAGRRRIALLCKVLETSLIARSQPVDRVAGIEPAPPRWERGMRPSHCTRMDRPAGLAPASPVWKTGTLLLCYGRMVEPGGFAPPSGRSLREVPTRLVGGLFSGLRRDTDALLTPSPDTTYSMTTRRGALVIQPDY